MSCFLILSVENADLVGWIGEIQATAVAAYNQLASLPFLLSIFSFLTREKKYLKQLRRKKSARLKITKKTIYFMLSIYINK